MINLGSWCLVNLMRGIPYVSIKYVKMVLPVLSKLINTSDEDVVNNVCWALLQIAISDDHIEILIQAYGNIIEKVILLLSSECTSIQV